MKRGHASGGEEEEEELCSDELALQEYYAKQLGEAEEEAKKPTKKPKQTPAKPVPPPKYVPTIEVEEVTYLEPGYPAPWHALSVRGCTDARIIAERCLTEAHVDYLWRGEPHKHYILRNVAISRSDGDRQSFSAFLLPEHMDAMWHAAPLTMRRAFFGRYDYGQPITSRRVEEVVRVVLAYPDRDAFVAGFRLCLGWLDVTTWTHAYFTGSRAIREAMHYNPVHPRVLAWAEWWGRYHALYDGSDGVGGDDADDDDDEDEDDGAAARERTRHRNLSFITMSVTPGRAFMRGLTELRAPQDTLRKALQRMTDIRAWPPSQFSAVMCGTGPNYYNEDREAWLAATTFMLRKLTWWFDRYIRGRMVAYNNCDGPVQLMERSKEGQELPVPKDAFEQDLFKGFTCMDEYEWDFKLERVAPFDSHFRAIVISWRSLGEDFPAHAATWIIHPYTGTVHMMTNTPGARGAHCQYGAFRAHCAGRPISSIWLPSTWLNLFIRGQGACAMDGDDHVRDGTVRKLGMRVPPAFRSSVLNVHGLPADMQHRGHACGARERNALCWPVAKLERPAHVGLGSLRMGESLMYRNTATDAPYEQRPNARLF